MHASRGLPKFLLPWLTRLLVVALLGQSLAPVFAAPEKSISPEDAPPVTTNAPQETAAPSTAPTATAPATPATTAAATTAPATTAPATTAPAAVTTTQPTSASQPDRILQPIKLKESEIEVNKVDGDTISTLHLNPVYLSRAIEMHSFDALRRETNTTQMITLREAINYVLRQGMSIKVSRESMNYQHYLTNSSYASFLPTFSMSYNLSQANVFNDSTRSIARTFLTGVTFPVFQGGGIVYSLMAQRYREEAWKNAYKATVSDVFLDVYQKYTNLLLQRVLLQTWAKTIEADEESVRISQAQLGHGTGTNYQVLQADAQLSADKQSFLQQAVTMRTAGLALNSALNMPLSINLVPVEENLTEAAIFKPTVKLRDLIDDTMRFNAGIKQYENFRRAATKNIQVQAASLYPSVAFFVLYQLTNDNVTPSGNSGALGGVATSAIASFLDSSFAGRVSNNALGQQYTFSPTAGDTSTQGANTGPSAMPAASGGTPIAQVQSGSLVSSGAVAPSIFGGGSGSSSGPNTNGSLQAPSGIFPGFFKEIQLGFQLNWSLPNWGMQTVATAYASRVLARQALMQCNQELTLVVEKVRADYLAVVSAKQANDAAEATASAYRQALSVAQVRFKVGVGTQLELIQAQRDYVQSLTGEAQSIVSCNMAQAQLLHDMGIITASTLTDGYTPGKFVPAPFTRKLLTP